MDAGAQSNGIDIQYCMTLPRVLWETVALPSVTRARVSEDYIAVKVQILRPDWLCTKGDISERGFCHLLVYRIERESSLPLEATN